MNKQFTPAPWHQEAAYLTNDLLDVDDSYIRITAGDGNYNVASKEHLGFELSGYIKKEDARLIAAAPEMFELLEKILNALKSSEYSLDTVYMEECAEMETLLNRITQH